MFADAILYVLPFSGLSFPSFFFVLFASIESAALRPIVL